MLQHGYGFQRNESVHSFMNAQALLRIAIAIEADQIVSGLWQPARDAKACYVFAHGAGAGMDHPFISAMATGLADRGITTLRYQFAFMEKGSKRPDPPRVAHAVVQAAVAEAKRRCGGLPLVAGGKSYGGRMTSQAQAVSPLPGVVGLAFVGFPLHAAGKPAIERSKHLFDTAVPSLFLQGTRDELADRGLMQSVVDQLGPRATIHLVDDADHSFHVRKSSGRSDAEVIAEASEVLANWMKAIAIASNA